MQMQAIITENSKDHLPPRITRETLSALRGEVSGNEKPRRGISCLNCHVHPIPLGRGWAPGTLQGSAGWPHAPSQTTAHHTVSLSWRATAFLPHTPCGKHLCQYPLMVPLQRGVAGPRQREGGGPEEAGSRVPSPASEPTPTPAAEPQEKGRFTPVSPGTSSRSVSRPSLHRLGASVCRSGSFPSIYVSSSHDSNFPRGFLLHL